MTDEFDMDGISDFDSELDLTIYSTQDELVREVAAQALQVIEDRLLSHGLFHLALTGGSLGNAISTALVTAWNHAPEMYAGLHIWWSDERFVASDSAERNAHPVHGKLHNSNITVHESLASELGASVSDAVRDYESALEGVVIDLNILGLGPDGHVASLFPGQAHLDRLEKVIAITQSPKPPAIRATFTMSMINASTIIWIIASGAAKADAVTKIIEGDLSIPASYLRATDHTRLIVDTDAFFTE
jgi:6-phosphogluconolactonase